MNGVCIIKSDDDIYNSQLRRVQRNMKFSCKKGYNTFKFYKESNTDYFKRELYKVNNIIIQISL